MDTKTPSTPGAGNRTIPLLILGALGAVLFICAAAVIFYKNTQHLLASRGLEEHSQQVLNLLETAAQRTERMDYLGRLYLTEKNKDDLNTVQATAVQLDTTLSQLEDLIWDSNQRNRARSAHVCAHELTQQINGLLQQSTESDRMSLTRRALECRDIISRMQVEETILLKRRTEEAERGTYRNQITGVAFLAVSLAVVLSLFGFLLRDARQRIATEKQLFRMNEQLNHTIQTLENQANETSLRAAMRGDLQLCANLSEAYRTTVRYIAQVVPSANVTLLTVNTQQQLLEIGATSDAQAQILDGVPLNACCAMRGARSRRRAPGHSEIDCSHFQGTPPQNYLCIPLAAQGQVLGVLYLGCPDESDPSGLDTHLDFLYRLTELSSMWIAGLNLRLRLEEESIRDGLTNLFNRRFMEIALDRELRLAARRKGELSLWILDIDHFKYFNDSFGHEAGDQVLRGVAELLSASVRTEDIVCRYGGEEFLVILPGIGSETAFLRAEEIRKRVSEMHLDIRGEGCKDVTISIGVSTYPHTGQTIDELVRAGDRALYHAKESGRNRVSMAESAIAV
ncbi:MAG TPA: sensor domain-containing diguanylate cyclase [Alloacidobacterium sp.]|nr:sensor domain-containing diguanylate cyclase [Alloacidobacterium sp.]